ncbi:hypothetical protein BDW22DRAFT_1359218 [Trametopsis cervina]|nr:hypothetical protein BDW22DRAFT_1359218 [Trametopsis cervina]
MHLALCMMIIFNSPAYQPRFHLRRLFNTVTPYLWLSPDRSWPQAACIGQLHPSATGLDLSDITESELRGQHE